jgi:hypothetical protein
MMRIMTLMNTMNSFDVEGRLMRFSISLFVEQGSLGRDHMDISLLCINAGMLYGYSSDASVTVYYVVGNRVEDNKASALQSRLSVI